MLTATHKKKKKKSAIEELDRETGEEQITVCRTRIDLWRMTDYRRERQSYVSRAGDEGGQSRLRWEDCVN